MDGQKFRVGQRVRVEDVHEGVITLVAGGGVYVDGLGRLFQPAPGMTRTITILSEPKPDEPTGIAAVVRDAEGTVWVRSRHVDGREMWRNMFGYWRTWAHIDAVEILFPGVES